MASTHLPLPTAPNFTGDNYDFWATKMQRFLMATGLWDVVDKGFQTPLANKELTDQEQQKISKENSSKDAEALFILQSAISDKIFPSIIKASTANEAWTILHNENQDTKKKEVIDWMKSVRAMQYHSGAKCNISNKSIVPKQLRKGNEDSYEPKFVSIGPRFRGSRRGPLKMEEIKWQCMSSFLDRLEQGNAEGNLAKCGQLILQQKEVLASYVDDPTPMKSRDMANIMLYDACFVLELLNSGLGGMFFNSWSWEERDKVLSDLLVLDNQIPFSILRELYCHLFGETDDSVEALALEYLFGYEIPDRSSLSADTKNASNFVELVHSYISMDLNDGLESNQHTLQMKDIESVQLDRCASRLRAAGVKIDLLRNDFPVGVLDFRIRFNSGTLNIPPLDITETTKARWQNLIAWEHHKMGTSETFKCKCTSAALFFNALICCESDVQLLKDNEIIKDYLHMSNKDLVTFFRSIIRGIDQDKIDPRYNICHFGDLKKYYSHPIRRCTQFPLRSWHYLTGSPREALCDLHNFLKRGYNYAAALITILSLLSTIYTVLSYYHAKK